MSNGRKSTTHAGSRGAGKRGEVDAAHSVKGASLVLDALELDPERRELGSERLARLLEAESSSARIRLEGLKEILEEHEPTGGALLLQAVLDPPDHSVAIPVEGDEAGELEEWAGLRGLFPHQLAGVSDSDLERIRGVLRLLCEALESNDIEALEMVAGNWERLLGIDGLHARVKRIYDLLDRWLDAFATFDTSEREALSAGLWVCVEVTAIAMVSVPGEVIRDLVVAARAATRHRGVPGRMTARALTVLLLYRLRAFGVKSEKQAEELVKSALKARKVRAKKG